MQDEANMPESSGRGAVITPESGREPSEMVDRVAKAILDVSNEPRHGEGWEDLSEGWRDNLREHARAAIRAMREPPDDVLEGAANVACDHASQSVNSRILMAVKRGKQREVGLAPVEWLLPAWQAMIDAALGAEKLAEHCKRCCRVLDVPGDIASENCGGDCCACMADAGDPDCIAALGAGQAEGEG